ncbi:MAG TPA: hypothetical protein VG228_02305 [Solirubrobacteraceae bacterium]|nr:hypothetical protein [Solirubrobacteraceae bacterium]
MGAFASEYGQPSEKITALECLRAGERPAGRLQPAVELHVGIRPELALRTHLRDEQHNLYCTGTPDTLFNPGAGLGIPNLSKLEADYRSAG